MTSSDNLSTKNLDLTFEPLFPDVDGMYPLDETVEASAVPHPRDPEMLILTLPLTRELLIRTPSPITSSTQHPIARAARSLIPEIRMSSCDCQSLILIGEFPGQNFSQYMGVLAYDTQEWAREHFDQYHNIVGPGVVVRVMAQTLRKHGIMINLTNIL